MLFEEIIEAGSGPVGDFTRQSNIIFGKSRQFELEWVRRPMEPSFRASSEIADVLDYAGDHRRRKAQPEGQRFAANVRLIEASSGCWEVAMQR